MKLETLRDLLAEQVQDLYSAESQLVKALPEMAKAASSAALKNAIKTHLEQTKEHVERLERVAKALKIETKGKKCKAMEGLIEEGQELIKEKPDPEVLDAGIIAAAQRVEHYEISAYGTARAYAKLLGKPDVADWLQMTLNEEGETDKNLTRLAETQINVAAVSG
jgi:ferritin-like metal-binding protein YciE